MICLLEEGGLTFRGDDETFGSPNDGNFLGLLELIAKFDSYLLVMGRILGIGIENRKYRHFFWYRYRNRRILIEFLILKTIL